MASDPPRKDGVENKFDARGVRILNADLSFFASATEAEWSKVVESAHLRQRLTVRAGKGITPNKKKKFSDVSFVALPQKLEGGPLYFSGGAHESSPAKGVDPKLLHLHWHFEWEQAPSETPPGDMKTRSDEVGGYPNVLNQIARAWPVQEAEVEVEAKVHYLLDGSRLALRKGLSPEVQETIDIKSTHGSHVLRSTSKLAIWKVEPASNGLRQVISAVLTDRATAVTGVFAGKLTISKEMFQALDAKVWTELNALLLESRG